MDLSALTTPVPEAIFFNFLIIQQQATNGSLIIYTIRNPFRAGSTPFWLFTKRRETAISHSTVPLSAHQDPGEAVSPIT